jgi:hypothetical protein
MSVQINGTSGITFNDSSVQEFAGVGYSQTWQNPSRSANTTYTNTTGRPIFISIISLTNSGINLTVNGINVASAVYFGGASNTVTSIVPNNGTYSVDAGFVRWSELR